MENIKKNKDKIIKEIVKTCSLNTLTPTIFEKRERIIVIGDIHGDMDLLINILKLSKLIKITDNKLQWIGGDTIVIQVGDLIDRCRKSIINCNEPNENDENSDYDLIKYYINLDKAAEKKGGRFITLLGNHEIMNVNGNFSYVSYKGIKEFNDSKSFEEGIKKRKEAFRPGGEISKLLGCYSMGSLIIDNILFVHAGIIDSMLEDYNIKDRKDLENINLFIKMWLLGLMEKDEVLETILNHKTKSMFWNRILGLIEPGVELNSPDCINNISKTLKLLSIGNIIIGHTPQSLVFNKDINYTCSKKVWRVDNGSSKAFDRNDNDNKFRKPQALEIINGEKFYLLKENERKLLF